MLITTSRQPGHSTRVLCRELVRVIPKSLYVPRGAKTIEQVVSVAREMGHDRVVVVASVSGKPRELRFLEVDQDWRWADAFVELGEVKINRGIWQGDKIDGVKIYADGARALSFADWVGKILGIKRSGKLPMTGAVALIKSEDGLKVQFRVMPGSEEVGPAFKITAFGNLLKKDRASEG